MDVLMSTKTKLYENGGHVFYNVTSTKIAYTIQGLKLRLNNLFEGVKALGNFLHNLFFQIKKIFNYFFIHRGEHKSIFE